MRAPCDVRMWCLPCWGSYLKDAAVDRGRLAHVESCQPHNFGATPAAAVHAVAPHVSPRRVPAGSATPDAGTDTSLSITYTSLSISTMFPSPNPQRPRHPTSACRCACCRSAASTSPPPPPPAADPPAPPSSSGAVRPSSPPASAASAMRPVRTCRLNVKLGRDSAQQTAFSSGRRRHLQQQQTACVHAGYVSGLAG